MFRVADDFAVIARRLKEKAEVEATCPSDNDSQPESHDAPKESGSLRLK
jgi:hypothetical protein